MQKNFIQFGARCAGGLAAATLCVLVSLEIRKSLSSFAWKCSQFKSDRITDIHTLFRSAMIVLSIGLTFGTTPSNILRHHRSWLVLEFMIVLANIQSIQQTINTFPPYGSNIGHRIYFSIEPILRSSKVSGVFGGALQTAVVEEILFRGILQEGILRQLPKLILAKTSRASPTCVDSLVFRIMRIGVTALAFGMAHSHKGTIRLVSTSLMGSRFGYLQEHFGLPAAIISHFANNFYVNYIRHIGRNFPS